MFKKLALIVLAATAAAEVIDLTPDNFDDVVNGDKHVLVKFFAPWCGHCKAMAEDYITASDAFKKYPEVVIAEVDADKHKSLGGKFEVSGFPTIKWFAKGSTEAVDYSGGRGLDDIINFVNGKAKTRAFVAKAPSDVTVLTPSNFRNYLDKDAGKLLEFYAPWCGHCKALAPVYEKVATTFANEDTVIVANVDADAHKSLGQKFDVSGFPTLKWLGADCHDKDCAEDYNAGREGDDLVKFINDKMGLKRVLGGGLSDDAGIDSKFDDIIPKFMDSTSDQEKVIEEAEKLATDADSSFYIKVMKHLVRLEDEGTAWLKKEVVRLAGMLDKPVAAKKKDEFTKRLNIVRQFHNEL